MIKQQDSLAFLKEQPDLSVDINYSDPPYALGSEITIRPDGKVDYKNASDFMDKWEMPTGDWWSDWFKEAFRTTKHGGYCIMFGMDRQLLLFKYYAHLAGFTEKQSMYWYFISNFPKATDLSKMIDKNAGAEREVTGKRSGALNNSETSTASSFTRGSVGFKESFDTTAPSTPLAQKYSGYKYSISPLKQTNETIMIFQKPYKTKSCLHDTLAYENGDESISVGAVDIERNRVGYQDESDQKSSQPGSINYNADKRANIGLAGGIKGIIENNSGKWEQPTGRYPSQTLCDTGASEVLDRQSGVSKSTGGRIGNKGSALNMTGSNYSKGDAGYGDTAGCSKILHKCDNQEDRGNHWLINDQYAIYKSDGCVYDTLEGKDIPKWVFEYRDMLLGQCDFELNEHDLYHYKAKVSKKERNAGCEDRPLTNDNRDNAALSSVENRQAASHNSHPTLKPIALNEKVLKLFKTPNDQRILFPFAGAGSEIIGGIKAGFTNWSACELSEEYVEIAKARIAHWTNEPEQNTLF